MIGIVVVTHGQLAEELVNAARTIVGEHPGHRRGVHRLGRRREPGDGRDRDGRSPPPGGGRRR